MDLVAAIEVRLRMTDPGAVQSPKFPIDQIYAMKEKDQNFSSRLAVNPLKASLLPLDVSQVFKMNLQFVVQKLTLS